MVIYSERYKSFPNKSTTKWEILMSLTIRKNRFSALEELSKIFPDVDTNPLKKIKNLYNNLEDLDRLYRDIDRLKIVWEESVSFFESLVKNYLELKK